MNLSSESHFALCRLLEQIKPELSVLVGEHYDTLQTVATYSNRTILIEANPRPRYVPNTSIVWGNPTREIRFVDTFFLDLMFINTDEENTAHYLEQAHMLRTKYVILNHKHNSFFRAGQHHLWDYTYNPDYCSELGVLTNNLVSRYDITSYQ